MPEPLKMYELVQFECIVFVQSAVVTYQLTCENEKNKPLLYVTNDIFLLFVDFFFFKRVTLVVTVKCQEREEEFIKNNGWSCTVVGCKKAYTCVSFSGLILNKWV